MTRLTSSLLALFALASLSACGLQGDLSRPDPLWGTPDANDAAELPERQVTEGVSVIRDDLDDEDFEDDAPDAEDELLGGPGG